MNAEQTSIGGYRITDILGEGGMGKVYIAEHELLGRRAAIKVLLPEYSNDQEVVNRFFKEAKAATAIRHPGIVKVYDFGYQEDGSAYIAMEYMEGEPLDARLRRLGRLPVEQALRLAGQMASALAAAHEHGIVHRDLKPANVYIVSDPQVSGGERVKLLDFGIAKFSQTDDPDAKQTRAGAILGSPQYMAPEQIRGSRDVDARADLYSLGCILFEMMCGRPPFDGGGNGAMAVMASHLDDPPPIPSTLRPDLAREADALILYLLAKDPGHRYQSAADVGLAIAGILGEQVSFASIPGHEMTAQMSAVERTAPSGVALSPAGVPLSDSQIISHATSQIGMQSAGTTTVAPAPGGKSQVRTQAVDLPARRSRVIALAAVVVLLAGGGVLAYTQLGGKKQAVVVNDEPAPEPVEDIQPDEVEVEPDEPPRLTYKTRVIPSSDGDGEPEVVIEMAVAANQGSIDWSKGFSLNNLITGAVFKDIISTIKLKVDPPKKVVWRIASQPRKAEVIDVRKGEVIGKTPLRIEFNESPDIQATYKVRADGHDDQVIELSGAKDFDQTVTLTRKMKVAIKSKPEGAAIFDARGTALGVTPAEVMLSKSDQAVALTLRFEGYDDLTVEVVPDRDRKEKFELMKQRAMITHRIDSEPQGATVFNEKKEEIGVTPFEVKLLEDSGRVKYYVELDKFQKETVRLDADKDDSDTVKLKKCEARARRSATAIGPAPVKVYGCD